MLKWLRTLILTISLVSNSYYAEAKEGEKDRAIDDVVEEKRQDKEENKYPDREISINIGSILDNYENNGLVFYSMQQLLGKGSDYLGIEVGWDNHVLGRVGQTAVLFYFLNGIRYYQHEVAHGFRAEERTFRIDFSRWWGYWGPYPKYESSVVKYTLSEEELIRSGVDGLNQEMYTSWSLWKRSIIKDEMPFDNSMYFLMNRFFLLHYAFVSNSNMYFKEQVDDNGNYEYDDVDIYLRRLQKKEIYITKGEFVVQSLVPTILSWHTFESVYSTLNYLIYGKRKTTLGKIEVADSLYITPPLITQYLTSGGTFYLMDLFVLSKDEGAIASLGVDTDWFGGGNLDTLRLGSEYYGINLGKFRINPFIYFDLRRTSFGWKGFSAGSEFLLAVTTSTALRSKVEYSVDDVLENEVKGKDNGINFVLGIDVNF